MLRHGGSGRALQVWEILIPWKVPRPHQDIKALVGQAQLGDFHLADIKAIKGGRVAKLAQFNRFIVRHGRSESGVLVATCLCKRQKSETER